MLAKASSNDADDRSSDIQTQVNYSGIKERSLPILKGRISKVLADSFEDNRKGME